MRLVTNSAATAVMAAGIAVMLAGCSGGESSTVPGAQPPSTAQSSDHRSFHAITAAQVMRIAAAGITMRAGLAVHRVQPNGKSGKGIYVVTGPNQVNGYKANERKARDPFCVIAGGSSDLPGDIATDKSGNVWVPEIANPSINAIWETVEYAPGCGGQMTTLDDSATGQPGGVAVDSKGTVYVNNFVDPSFGPGNVAVYPAGQTEPATVLTSPLIGSFVIGVAVDGANDVYVTYDDTSSRTKVMEFPKGKGPGVAVPVTGFTVLCGIAFDSKQNMILTDFANTQDEVYAPPYSGAPSAVIPLVAGSDPLFTEVNKKNTLMYVAGEAGVDVYAYPSGAYQYSIAAGQSGGADGIALDPAARN